jgi:hypothetical protein
MLLHGEEKKMGDGRNVGEGMPNVRRNDPQLTLSWDVFLVIGLVIRLFLLHLTVTLSLCYNYYYSHTAVTLSLFPRK